MHSLQPSLRTILCNLGFRSVLPWDVPSESCRPGLVTCVLVQVKAALVPGRQQGRQQHVQQCLQQWRLRGKTASKGGCSTAAPGLVQNATAQAQPAAGCLQTGQLPCPRIWRRRRATKCNASCRAAFHPPSTRPPSHPPPAASPRAAAQLLQRAQHAAHLLHQLRTAGTLRLLNRQVGRQLLWQDRGRSRGGRRGHVNLDRDRQLK